MAKQLQHKSVNDLNFEIDKIKSKVIINTDLQCKQFCTSANDIFLKATTFYKNGDEENAYILFMRYLYIYQAIRKSYEFSKAKDKYSTILKQGNPQDAMSNAEVLNKSLSLRYDKLKVDLKYTKDIHKKFATERTDSSKGLNHNRGSTDQVESSNELILPEVPSDLPTSFLKHHSQPNNVQPKVQPNNVQPKVQPNNVQPKVQPNNGNISNNTENHDINVNGNNEDALKKKNESDIRFPTSRELAVIDFYSLLKEYKSHPDLIMVIDTRPTEEYVKARMQYSCIINIPNVLLRAGANINTIDMNLDKDTWPIWLTRTNKKYIAIFDDYFTVGMLNKNLSAAMILKEILMKFECGYEILLVYGGFKEWHLYFPSITTNPTYSKKQKPVFYDHMDIIKSLDYPELRKPPSKLREKDVDDKKIVNSDESESFLKVEGKKNEVKVDKLAEMIHNIGLQNKKELYDDIYIPKTDTNAKPILNKDTKQPASINTTTHGNNIVNGSAINNDGTSNILSNAFNERTIANPNDIKSDNDFVPQVTAFKKPLENTKRSNIDSPHQQPSLLKTKELFKKADNIEKNVEFPPMENVSKNPQPVLMKENTKSVEVSPVDNLKDKSSTMLRPNTLPPSTGPPNTVSGVLPSLSKTNTVATPSSEMKPSSVVLNTTNKSKPSKTIHSKEVPYKSLKPLKQVKSEGRYITTFGLPEGWEKAINHENGRIYYIDHNSKKTHWKLPADIQNKIKEKIKQEENADKSVVDKSKKRVAFKEERPSLKRSLSSPNLAEVDLGLSLKDIKKESTPVIDRSIKPKEQSKVLVDRSNKPVSAGRLNNLSPIYGSMGCSLTGLKNLGNTCYMNSVIQCLSNTIPLTKYFNSDTYKRDLNKRNMNPRPGELAKELAFLLTVLSSTQYRSVSPVDFKLELGRFFSQFSGYDQQDSHELLMFLLDGLHEDINKVKSHQAIQERETSNLRDIDAANLAWQDYRLNNDSVIVDLFQGQFRSTVVCLSCRNESKTFDAFNCLQLQLPNNQPTTLEKCIDSFTRNEKIGGNDSWKCSNCKCYREAAKRIEIWKLPPVLIIQLKRFNFDGRWHNKIQTNVNFPTENLNLSSHIRAPSPKFSNFNLYSIINHYGSFESGHYTAYCENVYKSKWYCYDDSMVKEVNREQTKTNAAYLLFYTAVNFRDYIR